MKVMEDRLGRGVHVAVVQGLADIARYVIGCQSTQETRV